MKELSLNILDIVQNSVKAEATIIEIDIAEKANKLTLSVRDNGHGMKKDFFKNVLDPFTTTRTTRKVGLGLSLLKMAAESTGGGLEIISTHKDDDPIHCGTTVCATFCTDHIDCPPLGDIVSSIVLLIQSAPFTPRYLYKHSKNGKKAAIDTDELHAELGADIPLNLPEVLRFIAEYLSEQEALL